MARDSVSARRPKGDTRTHDRRHNTRPIRTRRGPAGIRASQKRQSIRGLRRGEWLHSVEFILPRHTKENESQEVLGDNQIQATPGRLRKGLRLGPTDSGHEPAIQPQGPVAMLHPHMPPVRERPRLRQTGHLETGWRSLLFSSSAAHPKAPEQDGNRSTGLRYQANGRRH